jgi:class 3 adenylate cyclase
VRELAEGKGFLFGERGEVTLRGFDDPVRVFEVAGRPSLASLRLRAIGSERHGGARQQLPD